eukprot:CAMPEP_0198650604 /NCGR_PEP_ID=MMETSP1467-20131203/5093_1 /TAXON_ID=1462469 /ORGANISM="unid. sp., Strain CCMP2135" /LENGTH=153 /DNA_ID=CAMNT_0044386461 /DNA_START=1 /DNA_END=459 /DNA_ORIENTATION=-
MANTIWAFACIAWAQPQNFSVLASASEGRLNEFAEAEKSQLHLVSLHVRAEWPDLDFPLVAHSEALRSAYSDCQPTPSKLQRDVSVMLEELGWKHTFEYETDEGLSLDLAEPDSKRAIEVDGPSHYLQDAASGEYTVNGGTRFKSRLLRGFGW